MFNIARQIHVRTVLRPAHYHIPLSSHASVFRPLSRDDISLSLRHRPEAALLHESPVELVVRPEAAGWAEGLGPAFFFPLSPITGLSLTAPYLSVAADCCRILSRSPTGRHSGHHAPRLAVEQTVSGFRDRGTPSIGGHSLLTRDRGTPFLTRGSPGIGRHHS